MTADTERWMSRYECVECGQEVPDDRGHVHVRVGDAHTTSPTRQVYYVPEDELRGAVDALDFALRTVSDPDLTEVQIRERISGVSRRALDAIGESR